MSRLTISAERATSDIWESSTVHGLAVEQPVEVAAVAPRHVLVREPLLGHRQVPVEVALDDRLELAQQLFLRVRLAHRVILPEGVSTYAYVGYASVGCRVEPGASSPIMTPVTSGRTPQRVAVAGSARGQNDAVVADLAVDRRPGHAERAGRLPGSAAPVTTLEGAHAGLGAALGPTAATLFALALLASGIAASGVGTLASQVVMDGFLRRRIPLVLRRLVTLAPAVAVIAVGVDVTRELVFSQVVLSFGIPFALVPLVLLTRRRELMGALVNRRVTTAAASVVAAVVIALNLTLVGLTLAG